MCNDLLFFFQDDMLDFSKVQDAAASLDPENDNSCDIFLMYLRAVNRQMDCYASMIYGGLSGDLTKCVYQNVKVDSAVREETKAILQRGRLPLIWSTQDLIEAKPFAIRKKRGGSYYLSKCS